MEKSNNLVEKCRFICTQLNRSQKFYFFGLLSFVNVLVSYFLPFPDLLRASLTLSIILVYAGVFSDILIIYNKVWETSIGKGVLLLIFSLCVSFSYAFATQLINETVKFDTSKVVHSITFTSALLLPFLLILITYIVFAALFLLSQFYFVIVSFVSGLKDDSCLGGMIPKNIEKYPYKTFWVRMIIYPIAFGAVWGIAGALSPMYVNKLSNLTKEFVYFFDAKTYSRCIQGKGERVITVNDKEIVIVKKENDLITFEPKACKPKIKSTLPKEGK
jgi:hypothetical protein